MKKRKKIAFITGITGQDGGYLAQFLIEKNYQVFGTGAVLKGEALDQLRKLKIISDVHLMDLNLLDQKEIQTALSKVKPHEIYNLAGQSSVGLSIQNPLSTIPINAMAPLYWLESIRHQKFPVKFLQASSAEAIEASNASPSGPNKPVNPYALSKYMAQWAVSYYRTQFGVFSSNAILFNHESPFRSPAFVSKKIVQAVVQIKRKTLKCLSLGQIDSIRDWGYAPDFVEAMWEILRLNSPQDVPVGTGESHSVREFVEEAFHVVGIHIQWKGQGLKEVGLNAQTKEILVRIDKQFYRPSKEVHQLGALKKVKELNWTPRVKFKNLVRIMVQHELGVN